MSERRTVEELKDDALDLIEAAAHLAATDDATLAAALLMTHNIKASRFAAEDDPGFVLEVLELEITGEKAARILAAISRWRDRGLL